MFGNPVLTEEQQKAWLAKYAPDLDDPDRGALRRRRTRAEVETLVLPGGDDDAPGVMGNRATGKRRRRLPGRNSEVSGHGVHRAERLRAKRLSIERAEAAVFERLIPEEEREPLTAAETAVRAGALTADEWVFLQQYIYMPKRNVDQDPDPFGDFRFAGREESLKALADATGYTVPTVRKFIGSLAARLRGPLSRWGHGRLARGGWRAEGSRIEPRLEPLREAALPGYYRDAPPPASTGRPPAYEPAALEAALRRADDLAMKVQPVTINTLAGLRVDGGVSTAYVGVGMYYVGMRAFGRGPSLMESVVLASRIGRGETALMRLTRAWIERATGFPEGALTKAARSFRTQRIGYRALDTRGVSSLLPEAPPVPGT